MTNTEVASGDEVTRHASISSNDQSSDIVETVKNAAKDFSQVNERDEPTGISEKTRNVSVEESALPDDDTQYVKGHPVIRNGTCLILLLCWDIHAYHGRALKDLQLTSI